MDVIKDMLVKALAEKDRECAGYVKENLELKRKLENTEISLCEMTKAYMEMAKTADESNAGR